MAKPSPIVAAFEHLMPAVVSIACMILGVAPDTLLTYRTLPDGGVVIITGPGQKFTFTAEDLSEQPHTVRARLAEGGITILNDRRDVPAERLPAERLPADIPAYLGPPVPVDPDLHTSPPNRLGRKK